MINMHKTEYSQNVRTRENRPPARLLPLVHLLVVIDRSESMDGIEQHYTSAVKLPLNGILLNPAALEPNPLRLRGESR